MKLLRERNYDFLVAPYNAAAQVCASPSLDVARRKGERTCTTGLT